VVDGRGALCHGHYTIVLIVEQLAYAVEVYARAIFGSVERVPHMNNHRVAPIGKKSWTGNSTVCG
jgi:hypothetical protein